MKNSRNNNYPIVKNRLVERRNSHWYYRQLPFTTMKKVLIVQQMIPEYRIGFFSLLRSELAKENIELSLVYGQNSTNYKSGSQYFELDWGNMITNKTIKIGKVHLCLQPVSRKYLNTFDLIIVEKSNKLLLNYYLMAIRKFRNFKLGFWGHGRDIQSRPDSLNNKFGYYFLKQCDWWWAYTRKVRDFIEEKHFPSEKITVVQNAIDTEDLQIQTAAIKEDEVKELRNTLGIKGDKVGIFCGGMYAGKRLDFLLDACFIIKKKIPEFEMIFIGAGKESYKIQNAAQKHSWIHYAGSINNVERINYFKVAAVQLMPGLVGLGILDSFALDTPLITTNIEFHSPEIEYLENGKNGIMTENNLQVYSETVINVLNSKSYEDLIPGCRASAKKYTIGQMVENFKGGIVLCLDQK